MVEFLTFLSKYLSGTALYTVVAVVGCVLLVPQVVKVWDSFKDFRAGKRELGMQQMQLEVLKIRYEIELLKRKLAEPLDGDEKPVAAPAAVEASPVPHSSPAPAVIPPKQWAWLRRLASHHRSRALALLKVLYGAAWCALLLLSAFLAFTLFFVVVPPPGLTSSEAASTLVVFLPAMLASYLAVHRLRAQRRVLMGTT